MQALGVIPRGAVVIDLASRTLTRVDPPEPRFVPVNVARVPRGPFEVDGVLAEFVVPSTGGSYGLRRSRGGRALPDTVLPVRGYLLLSVDLRHVLDITSSLGPPYPASARHLNVWSTVTGAPVPGFAGDEEFVTDEHIEAFVMLGDRMIFVAEHVDRNGVSSERVGMFDRDLLTGFVKPIHQRSRVRSAPR
jgi:hypothetical protein